MEHPFIETFGSVNEPSFLEAEGMAIDQSSENLLVIDGVANTVSRWNSDGTPANFSALGTNVIDGEGAGDETPQGGLVFGGAGEVQIAVDNSGGVTDGNIYVTQAANDLVDIFGEDGIFLGQLSASSEGPFGEPCGVAVDPSGNVYVGDFNGKVRKFIPAANPPVNGDNSANFSFASVCPLAAGAGPTVGAIFPAHFAGSVAKIDSTTGVEKYPIDPGPTTTATIDPTTGVLFTASGGEVKEFDVAGETGSVPLTPIPSIAGRVTGIAVSEASGNIYVARGEDSSQIEVFGEAVQLPIAITEAASVIGETVTMRGVVNANGGSNATCEFEYVEVSAEGFKEASTEPCSPAGPFTGTTSFSVSAEVSGLAEAAYRFRLLASNEDASKTGETLFFDTFEKVPGLPDVRAYEMVSPPQKAGEVIPPEPAGQLGGSCGDCLPGGQDPTMPMQTTPEGDAVLYLGQPFTSGLASGPNEYVAPRNSVGWGTQSLSAPTTIGQFLAFSEDLSRGILAQANPPLSPQAPTRGGIAFRNLYLQEGGASQPLITKEPPNREPSSFRASFGGANAGTALVPGFGQVAFEANDALTEEDPGIAPAAPEVGVGKECSLPGANCNLYEWEGGELRLINVLPDETAGSNAVIGAGRMLAGLQIPVVSHAISDDGSRIFWSSEQTGEVYVRVDGEETLEIPGAGTCEEIVPVENRACFLTATPDGSTVLLSDGTVYELNGAETAYELAVDLTETKGGFEGILGTSEDLSRIYFVDTAALTAESEENENGEHAEADELNLYAFDEGELDFIGMLAPGDNGFGVESRFGAWTASPSNRTAQASSDGGHLAFMSLASLTGYDNTLSGGGNCGGGQTPACREVFVYSADLGELSCASCNPSGEQPLGPSNLSLLRPLRSAPPFRQPGNLSREGDGRLFFESLDALVARDVNGGTQDVYEWEPNGVGSCKRATGCVSLISSGQSPNDSMFMDSSDSGDDAFFITREKLLPRDKNEQLDLYDARVGGGFEEVSPAPCSPESCAGPIASPPAQPSAASQEFTGPGNPKPKRCKAGFVKKQGKCVKKKPKKKKKAANNRGGSR
ncbi:MAG: hypothetical protein WBL45_09620 [Solirubrobacterales bacterium]